jgi:hypothetical protein
MSTISTPNPQGGQPVTLKTYSHANKVFNVGSLPIGVLTYGIGNIGHRSIGSFILEFGKRYLGNGTHTVEQVAIDLYRFLNENYEHQHAGVEAPSRPALGIYVAGYDSHGSLATEWEFVLPTDVGPRLVRPAEQFGASWRGMDIPFTRLFFGLDPRSRQDLGDAKYTELTQRYQFPVICDPMPLQDAIDFAKFILQTTVGMSRFMVGSAICGGALDVAAIAESESGATFTWVNHKKNLIDRRMS